MMLNFNKLRIAGTDIWLQWTNFNLTHCIGCYCSIGTSLYGAIKNTTNGFGVLFKETKVVIQLAVKSKWEKSSLKRSEIELTRSNREALHRMVFFFILQSPPFIGYIPLLLAMRYPRQVFTHHFWTAEQKIAFLGEEFAERRNHALVLGKMVEFSLSAISENSQPQINLKHLFSELEIRLVATSLESVSNSHLTALAGAVGVCSNQLTLKLSHPFLLKSYLSNRAQQIIEDDEYIQRNSEVVAGEVVVDGRPLSTAELIEFCARRGFNCSQLLLTPSDISSGSSNSDRDRRVREAMNSYLMEWIDAATNLKEETKAIVVLHSIAFNSIINR